MEVQMEHLSSNGLMSKITRLIRRVIIFSLLAATVFAMVFALQFYEFTKKPLAITEQQGVVFEIANGTSVKGIAKKLYKENLISQPTLFIAYVTYSNAWGKLKAGEYLLKPGTTPKALIHQLIEGKGIQHGITIVEGWTFEKLMQVMNDSPKIMHTLKDYSSEQIMEKLGYKGLNPEGRFFPETYYYTKDTADLAILKRAYLAMEGKLSAMWYQRASNLPFKTPYEALIMASIVEREIQYPEEYAEISGVYVRRLQKDMLLQADPTVIYGLGKHYKPPLTLDMLRYPSPYNTYLNKGLPPTPIAMPSARALAAALHPEPGDTLFFVAKPNGKGHIFARNYEEHRDNVRDYRDNRDLGDGRNVEQNRLLRQEDQNAINNGINNGVGGVPIYIDPNTIPNPDPTIGSPQGTTTYQTPIAPAPVQPTSVTIQTPVGQTSGKIPTPGSTQNMQLVAPRTNPSLPAGPSGPPEPLILKPVNLDAPDSGVVVPAVPVAPVVP